VTFEEWSRREDLQSDWERTWREPHMVAGLEVLRRLAEPRGTPVADINLNALKNAFTEGQFRMLREIDRLKPKDPTKTTQPLPAAWGGMKREEEENG
jgi:hypothetical protein